MDVAADAEWVSMATLTDPPWDWKRGWTGGGLIQDGIFFGAFRISKLVPGSHRDSTRRTLELWVMH